MMSNKNIVFLDYDGVVNTPMWNHDGTDCSFNYPKDNAVNNFQCVQWVSEFCKKFNYDIVVSSTWRVYDNYKECLINGGLREGIKIFGKTPVCRGRTRGTEIQLYLEEHPEIENFIIFDDDDDMEELYSHLVKCDTNHGFGLTEYRAAISKHILDKTKRDV